MPKSKCSYATWWVKTARVAILPLFMATIVAGCGKSDPVSVAPTSNSVSVTATINPAVGGTVTHPDGVQVVIPAGALSQATPISITSNPSGPPASLQVGNAPAGPIYEFTPHDIVFNTPVTIRIPLPPGAVASQVFMASLGGNWVATNATEVGGFAVIQRNSFSFSLTAQACVTPVGSPPDPYRCTYPSGGVAIDTTSSATLTQLAPGWNNGFMSGSAGSWQVGQAGTVVLRLEYAAAPDCSDPRMSLTRLNLAVPPNHPNRRQALLDNVLTPGALVNVPVPPGFIGAGSASDERLVGSRQFDVSAHLTDPTNAFTYSFTCQRPTWTGPAYGQDTITILGPMAPPSGPFTIGVTVSGLSSGGSVELQNNGGDNLTVSANGSFTFATPIPAGASYGVTVFTSPSGQTCTVQNGSGTATANVSNVLVTCVSSAPGLALVMGQNNLSIFHRNISTGELTPATPAIVGASDGAGIALTPDGHFAYVLDRRNFSVSLYSVDAASGVVAPLAAQPSVPGLSYPNYIVMDPLGRFVWIASWNASSESVRTYSVNSSGQLSFRSVIHDQQYALAAHPTGDYVYGVNGNNHTITGYSVNQSNGALTLLPGSSLSTGAASSPFRIAITPDGRFAYVANQGSNTIAIFSINTATGVLTSAGSVSTASSPYGIRIHPNGRYLYVAEANDLRVAIYAINPSTGALTSQGSANNAAGTVPYNLAVTAGGDFLYTAGGDVSAFSIDSSTGNLTLLPGQPVSIPQGAGDIVLTP